MGWGKRLRLTQRVPRHTLLRCRGRLTNPNVSLCPELCCTVSRGAVACFLCLYLPHTGCWDPGEVTVEPGHSNQRVAGGVGWSWAGSRAAGAAAGRLRWPGRQWAPAVCALRGREQGAGESPFLGWAGGSGCGAERGAHSWLAGRPALMSFPHGPEFPARHDHTGKALPRPPPPQLPPSHSEGGRERAEPHGAALARPRGGLSVACLGPGTPHHSHRVLGKGQLRAKAKQGRACKTAGGRRPGVAVDFGHVPASGPASLMRPQVRPGH